MLKEEPNNNNSETPIVQATIIEPVPNRISIVPTSESNLNVNDTMKLTYSLSKTLKFLCGIDIFFSIIYSFYEPFMFIPLICALSGYYGAKKYKIKYINVYAVYQFIVIILRSILLIYTITNTSILPIEVIFFIFNQLIAIWTLKIIFKLYKLLSSLNNPQIELLRNIGYIPTARVVYY